MMNAPQQKPAHESAPEPGEETPIPELEADETTAPRPEEELADLYRSEPAGEKPAPDPE